MKSTQDNLKEAFAGESQAVQKYQAFARKAERDGFANIARLFRTAAEANFAGVGRVRHRQGAVSLRLEFGQQFCVDGRSRRRNCIHDLIL